MNTKEYLKDLKENNHLIINTKKNYENIMLGKIISVEENYVQIIWFSINQTINENLEEERSVSLSFKEFENTIDPFVVISFNKNYVEKEYREIQNKLSDWYKIVNEFYQAEYHRVELKSSIKLISKYLSVTEDLANSILKVNIARGQFHYVKLKVGEYISLSQEVLESENKKRYLTSISDEIKSQSNRINYVVNHSQTVGNYREKLFISVLKKYIPKKFHIATGFIEGSPKQIDIIIYDQHNYIPVFREEDLVIVKKEAVIAIIEIKTTLDSKSLTNSLEGIENINEIGINSLPFFKGIFAFDTKMNAKSIINNISSFYNEYPINAVHNHLNVVCIPKKHCFFIDYNNVDVSTKKNACPTLFEVENIKGIDVVETVFFQKLFSFLEVEKSAKQLNLRYFDKLNSTALSIQRKILTEDDWLPTNTFMSEYLSHKHLDLETEFEQVLEININNVKHRISNVERWIYGELSRDEMIDKYYN